MKKVLFVILGIMPVTMFAQIELMDIIPEDNVERVKVSDGSVPEVAGHGTAPVSSQRSSDTIHFMNLDRMTGTVMEIDAEKGLVFNHPDASVNVSYLLENMKSIDFKSAQNATSMLFELPVVQLTNGDRYRGKIVRMNEDQLVLESPLAGEIKLQSNMVQSIRPEAVSTAIYEGPNSIEEWEQNNNSNGSWEYKSGALYSDNHNQIVGMELEDYPDKSVVEMDIAWKGNMNLQIGFWGRETKNVNQNCYTLSVQNSYMRCYRNYNGIGRSDIGNVQVRSEMNDGEVNLKLLLNREKKEVIVILDGSLVAQWRDTFEGDIIGDSFLLGGMGNNPVKVTGISIRQWDGELDLDEEENTNELDQLITSNGDVFAGDLQKIEMGTLYFKNDFAVFEVPLDRVSQITMSENTRSVPRLQQGDVEIYFPNDERITLKLANMNATTLTGFSESTGEIQLFRKYFHELKLNPYDERHNIEEEGW